MKVFVAGATGVVGAVAVRALVAGGHSVRGSARSDDGAALLRSLGAAPVRLDLFDPGAVRRAVDGVDAVVRLTTRIPPLWRMRRAGAWGETDRLRTEGARILVDAALDAGCAAYLHESVSFLYADGGERWLDEDAPVDTGGWPPMEASLRGEAEAGRFTAAGGRGIVLRFGAFYSRHNRTVREIERLARLRLFPVFGAGDNYISPLWVPDAGAAVAAALGAPSGAYNVCDDEPLPMREYGRVLAETFGTPRPPRLPRALGPAFLGRGPAGYLLRSQRISNSKLKEATGWVPAARSLAEGLRRREA